MRQSQADRETIPFLMAYIESRRQLSEAEAAVHGCFAGGERLSADRLAELTGRPLPKVSALLTLLELKRLVVKRADGLFEAK